MKKPSKTSRGKLRIVTATTLFDGHDASINIFRRLLQSAGAEVIHLGHNRSAEEIVHAAIQEGAHAIAASSYQGGHMEFFKYIVRLLKERGVEFIRVFGGGGGVIVPEEIRELEASGVTRIYSPEDGQRMGLAGIIDDMMNRIAGAEFRPLPGNWRERLMSNDSFILSRLISGAQDRFSSDGASYAGVKEALATLPGKTPVVGITGTGGSGKSSLEDEFLRRFLAFYPDKSIAVLAIDPSKKKSGGALLGDRIRMNSLDYSRVYMHSIATRESPSDLPVALGDILHLLRSARFDLVLVETPGIGQGGIQITEHTDFSVYIMTAEYGAPTQLEKIDMLDYADLIVINKFDHRNSLDALRDVRKQYRRNHDDFATPDEDLPVVGTVASNYYDPGLDLFFRRLVGGLKDRGIVDWPLPAEAPSRLSGLSAVSIIPAERTNYLAEIANAVRGYHRKTREEIEKIRRVEAVGVLNQGDQPYPRALPDLEGSIDPEVRELLEGWRTASEQYRGEEMVTRVRERDVRAPLKYESLSGLRIPLVAVPGFESMADTLKWLRRENLPGHFPYTAGVFPFRRTDEDPKRQFAGEGPPERTNKRFHYLTRNDSAKRLSTAFDSVTLYGEDPTEAPDIFGKIGESGVSVCTLEDMKKLYEGFDLCDSNTSVSMTVNGPAPIVLAFFFNTAIDQQIEKFAGENGRNPTDEERKSIERHVLGTVRGTVQADILKEDQGQNSCIFSTGFALRMMGDIQQFFIANDVKNFYSVSISGYHIAEAGATPVSQLAFTLANAFTYAEYYLSRGMNIDDFAPNLSFFFSSGMEPEYSVLIRVARRIWAIAMKHKYCANELGQRLKCHIQTSGRSLHAQEIQFNDIRTTLQALMALTDNCNSLHTNSYDEAITTPTEESVRRAIAIQLIIAREYGIFKSQNVLQGSFAIEQLTDMVEETVLREFEAISRRGGVLGAMESHYQRGKIQDESLLYEHRKHTGEYPIIGVNTYMNPQVLAGEYERPPIPLTRATLEEKMSQIGSLRAFQDRHSAEAPAALERLKDTALSGGNIFAELMTTVRVASLGQITRALFQVGGQYRRNM
jgi:methylmalonyl-CoA mutase